MNEEIYKSLQELLPAIVSVAIFILLYLSFENRRRKKLKDFSHGRLLQFSPKEKDVQRELCKPGDLLGEAYNIMTGIMDGVSVTIYDYRRTPRNPPLPMDQTYCILESKDLHLPEFSLQPKKMMHRIGGLVGYQDIPFKNNEDLSRLYLLRGKEAAMLQKLFAPSVLSFLEKGSQIYLEGGGSMLKFYKNPGSLFPPSRVPASRMKGFLDEGLSLMRCFKEAAGDIPST